MRKYNITFGIAFVCVMLFTACDNFIEPAEINAPVSGYGRISISLAGGEAESQTARTVLPSTVFDKYVYTFTKTGETTGVEVNPDNEGFFTLEVGSYTVEVQAFTGNAEPYTLAATGVSEQFTVDSGDNDPVEVILTEVDTGGGGVFMYTITYPAGAAAVITLYQWPDLDEITLSPTNLTEGNGVTESLELEAASYLLAVLISKDGLYAGVSEAVHIYPETVTEYTKEFYDEDMIADIPPMVNDYTISGTGTLTYDGNAKTVNITPKENTSPGAITILYNETADEPVDAGTYTVTFDVAAVKGWSAATGLPAGTITIDKAVGAAVSAPVGTSSVTTNSITINDVTAPENGQTIEYAINTTNAAPSTGWQDSTTFSGLSSDTMYFIFARSKENNNYNTGAESAGLQVVTAFPLSADTWTDGSITSNISGVLYSFNVVNGTTYYVWWNDSKDGDSTKTMDVKAGAFYNDGSSGPVSIFTDKDASWANPQSFTANTAGAAYIWVTPYSAGSTGTFAVAYSAGSTMPSYIVTFDVNGGSGTVPGAQSVNPGSGITIPDDSGLSKTGYIFDGWNTDSSGTGVTYQPDDSFTPAANTTLYAKWNYLVTFDANGGIGTVPDAQSVTPGSDITIPSRGGLSKTGYIFDGWNTDTYGTGSNYDAWVIYTPVGSITLYAKWVTVTSVTVSPASARVERDSTQSFNATVYGENNPPQTVTWSIVQTNKNSGTTISSIGLLRMSANELLTKLTIRATSTVDTGKYGEASVTVPVYITNVNDIAAYLNSQTGGNSPLDPITLSMAVNLSESNWNAILSAIQNQSPTKLIALDLSACTHGGSTSGNGLRSNGTFSPGTANSSSPGVNYIVSLVLPDTATGIVSGINNSYTYLRTVSGSSITSIGSEAFRGCTSLTNVDFPEAVSVGNAAFQDCTGLINVSFPKATNIANGSNGGSAGYYGAFRNCTSLTIANFPNAASVGNYVFYGCTSLSSVTFTNATTIGDGAFYNSGLTSINAAIFPNATSIGNSAFYGCTGLTGVSFPKVTSIGSYAFYNSGLTTISAASFPEATSIGYAAFQNCTDLTNVSFPKVTSIANGDNGGSAGYYGAFRDCTSLASASFPNATGIGNYAFYGCTNLSSVTFTNATTIGSAAFYNNRFTTINTNSFPNATSIGSDAFNGCTGLTGVSFPKVTSIGSSAFYGCTGLTTISATSFPEAMSIGNAAFQNCTGLTSVSFPKVTSIASGSNGGSAGYYSAFRGCTSLSNVTLNVVTSIGSYAFAVTGSGALTITMGWVAPTVGSDMFTGVSAAKNVTVRYPTGASGYNATWESNFSGGNSNVTLTMQPYTP